ncbi:MAG: resolvase [Deltaproteobacteria bacterium HGW-Deltaproteobacteria-18]|jgi:DNA invertase Pin-like site-specific DNA recombinase|nr:MAG: resolvase [Deltaproteobacteria bacterium HGW-Deltaproteobacteria-18]
MSHIAYVRVSTTDQNTDRQLADSGIQFDKIFTDKTSGKSTDRPQLQACLEYLREGDTLHVHSIDRFARSLKDLQTLVDQLMVKGVKVQFHKENLVFDEGSNNPMNKLMFQIMGAFAEFERSVILERQREGIERAKEKGVYSHGKGGRKKTVDRDLVRKLRVEDLSLRKIAEQVGCSLYTVQRILSGDQPRESR